ncbi:MAG TPA: ATP-binding protein, partial [Caulobacteraceae bacterium]|nr:ATP-binding protein [Caulobacteraceae bacterium]
DVSLDELPGGAWPEPCRKVLTLPVQDADGSEPPSGALVCGLSAGLELDGPYRDYLGAVSARIAAMIKGVRIRRQERRRTLAVTMLNTFDRRLIATRTPGELVEVLLDATMALHGAELGNVQLYDQQDQRLRIAVQRGCGRALLDHFATVAAPDGSARARALRSGTTVMIEDVETDAEFAPHRAAAAAAGFRAVLAIPMLNSETREWVGMVSVHFRAPRSIRRSLIDFTEVHAKIAADLLVRRLAEQRLVESETQLLAAKEGLERRVAERTRDLESANRKLTLEIGQRSKAEEALRQMQRLEAVGQLTAGVAHDFNNLLTVVIGNAEFLSNRLTDTDALRRLAMVQASAERGAKLTAQLLAFSRQQQLSPRPVDINAIVKSMRELLRGALRGAIGLKVSLARRPWAALADPTQIELVILNLAINARDAMPDGGELIIETRNVQVRRRSRRPGAPEPGDYAVVGVRDTGSGMAPEVLARAFEPFFTTKPVGQGSGLGLAQVYGFAVQSGGGLTIDSKPGGGTAVRVFLPRAVADVESQPKAEAAIDDETGGRTILLVDDDALVRTTAAEMLASLGYRVVEAANGDAALDALDRRSDIDALVVDFGMPGMNGGEVARQAQARRPGTPLLFVTGFADRAALSQVPDANILQKPFRRSELAAKLAGALAGRTTKITATRGATGPGVPWPASAPEPN